MLAHTLRYISALVIAVLVLSPVVAQQTSAPIQVSASDTPTSPLYRYGQHVGDSSAPFTARWASIYQKRNAQVSYELCNAGSSAFIFNWDGGRWGVGQHNAVKPGTCPFLTFAAPNGVESGDAVIKYGPNRGNWNAVVHTPLSKQEPKPRPTEVSTRFGVSNRSQLISPNTSPSEESVSSTISCTVTTGFSWTADRMILWRSFSCMVPPSSSIRH